MWKKYRIVEYTENHWKKKKKRSQREKTTVISTYPVDIKSGHFSFEKFSRGEMSDAML